MVEGEFRTRRRLCDELAQYDLLVTFNGTSFDLPVLLSTIQGLPLDQPHIDLCLLGRQHGYRGGLTRRGQAAFYTGRSVRQRSRTMRTRVRSRGASTKDREVDRLEAAVVRTFSGAGCQTTHHVHLGPQVDAVARL